MLEFYHGENNKDQLQVGVDEVGRGTLAGPVVSAAVVWDMQWLNDNKEVYEKELSMIVDSKKLSEKKRNATANFIKSHALAYGIAFVSAEVIDEINILNATHKAMHKAIDNLIDKIPKLKIDNLLIDGNSFKPYHNKSVQIDNDDEEQLLCLPHVCIINGDNQYLSIAAASILAKTARDDYMTELCKADASFDEKFEWSKNKGYGTKKHLTGIENHGITDHHRKTFGICRRFA